MSHHPHPHHCISHHGFLGTCQLPQTAELSLESWPDKYGGTMGGDVYIASPFHSFSEAMLNIFLALPTTHCLGVQNLLIGSNFRLCLSLRPSLDALSVHGLGEVGETLHFRDTWLIELEDCLSVCTSWGWLWMSWGNPLY